MARVYIVYIVYIYIIYCLLYICNYITYSIKCVIPLEGEIPEERILRGLRAVQSQAHLFSSTDDVKRRGLCRDETKLVAPPKQQQPSQ